MHLVPPSSDDLAAILSEPARRDAYLQTLTAELSAHQKREKYFDEMRKALRRAAFLIDSAPLLAKAPVAFEVAKRTAQDYRDLADKADDCAVKDRDAQGEECSERKP